MMKRACKQSGIGCLVALLLAACGGGDGGSSGFTPPGATNVRALDPTQARTYFRGSTEPGLTASEAHSEIEQLVERIQGSEDRSLLMSDWSLFTTRDELKSSLPENVDAACSGTTCTYTYGRASLSIGVNDFSAGSGASLRPVMRHRGIPLAARADSRTIGGVGVESFGYGGWLDHSAFSVEGLTGTSGEFRGISAYYGASGGNASNSRPTGGSASWNGVMVATDVSGAGRENIIQGDAALSIDFGVTPTVDLTFSNVRDLTAGTTRPGTAWSDMPVTASGTFSRMNPQGETAGRFYGPEHQEAGGTFTYDDLTGAYGLKRQ